MILMAETLSQLKLKNFTQQQIIKLNSSYETY